MSIKTSELNTTELDAVSGGLKWTRGTKNDDVIDRRAQTGAQSAAIAGLIGGFGGGAGGAVPH
jgi:hypothetical protein